jgi:hypothetical protein
VKIDTAKNVKLLRKSYILFKIFLPQITEHLNRNVLFCPKLKPQNAILNFKIIFIQFFGTKEITLNGRAGDRRELKIILNVLRPVNHFVYCA